MSIYKGINARITRRVDIPIISAVLSIVVMGALLVVYLIKAVFARSVGLQQTQDEVRSQLALLCPRPVEKERLPLSVTNHYDLSVIVPVFNAQDFLQVTLESVLNQRTNFSYQVICVNDGSSDNSEAILSEYTKDQRVTVLHQPNAGIAAARNKGLAHAHSGVVMFLDADDILLPGAIELLMSEMKSSGSDIVVANFVSFSTDLPLTMQPSTVDSFQVLSTEDAWVTVKDGFPWGKVFRKSLWANIHFPEGYQFEDTIIKGLIFRTASQISYTMQPVLAYRQHGASVTQRLQRQPYSVIYVLWLVEYIIKRNDELGLAKDRCFALFIQSHLTKVLIMRTKYVDQNTLALLFIYSRHLITGYNLSAIGSLVERRAFAALKEGRFKAWYFWSSLATLEA